MGPSRLEITEEFLERMGDFSLVGALANMYGSIPDEVELVFFETSSAWRERVGGPKLFVLPEYTARCLAEQVLDLSKKCKVTVMVVEHSPPR